MDEGPRSGEEGWVEEAAKAAEAAAQVPPQPPGARPGAALESSSADGTPPDAAELGGPTTPDFPPVGPTLSSTPQVGPTQPVWPTALSSGGHATPASGPSLYLPYSNDLPHANDWPYGTDRPYSDGQQHGYSEAAAWGVGGRFVAGGSLGPPSDFGQPLYGDPPAGKYPSLQPRGWPRWPSKKGRFLRSTAAVLALVSAAAAGAALSRVAWPGAQPPRAASPSTTTPPAFGPSGASMSPAEVAEIAAKVDPAVVDVDVQFSYQNAEGAGTGIVLGANGLVLTNNHVIDESTNVSVTDIGNGRTYQATVLGYDSTHDVALLKLRGASGLPVAKIARSKARVGQPVVALGNAGGTGGTPAAAPGTVLALNQDITASDSLTDTSENLTGLIETSADVQSGDSGGPLVNSSGQVIGIDTAATGSFAFAETGNEGYAIPIARAMAIASNIEAGRETATIHVGPTAFIGLRLYSQDNANPFELPTGAPSGAQPAGANGLEVYAVIPGTAAARAGLAQGDVLTKFNGAPLRSDAQLAHILVRYHPGEKAEVGWVTPQGQHKSAQIELTSGPPA